MRITVWPLLGMAVAILASGCTPTGPADQPATVWQQPTIFYGTDRDLREPANPRKYYGEGRGALAYGELQFSALEGAGKPRLESVDPLPRESFLQALRYALANAQSPEILVFVHGFLRPFAQAGKVVAKFSTQTGFRGVPVLWSWPSTSNPARYTADETSARWAQRDFSAFLRDILLESGARKVHLVGHSLGGRSLVDTVLGDLIPRGVDLSGVGQFVLLAPDIDQDMFRRDMAPQLVEAGLDITLYTSNNDLALLTAHRVHGHRRAGDSSEGPLLFPGIETIDVTAVNKSILGHSYFEESERVSSDLAQLLNHGTPASERDRLEPVTLDGLQYWRLTLEN